MRRIEKVIQYFVLFFCMMILLLVLNVVFIGVVEVQTSDEQSYPKAEKMAEYLQWDENGKCAMAKEGTDIVDLYQGFAMVIDNTGKIIWEYKLPEELEQTYTLQEVAVFAKWYLKDYPVDIHVVPNGILVLGRPKDTIWKYNISHSLRYDGSAFKIYSIPFADRYSIVDRDTVHHIAASEQTEGEGAYDLDCRGIA